MGERGSPLGGQVKSATARKPFIFSLNSAIARRACAPTTLFSEETKYRYRYSDRLIKSTAEIFLVKA